MNVSSIISRSIKSDEYRVYYVTRLITPAVISRFPNLARHVTFVAEEVPYVTAGKDKDPNLRKEISFVFSRITLTENYAEIVEQIKGMLLTIETESELVQKDNLARGQLVDSVRVSITLQKVQDQAWWSANTDNLKCGFGENDPPEFWGDIGLYERDFIASSARYPWMPSEICKQEEIPF
jgi:hypothetical protein